MTLCEVVRELVAEGTERDGEGEIEEQLEGCRGTVRLVRITARHPGQMMRQGGPAGR